VEARRTDGINYIENDSVERLTKLSLQEQAKLLTA
jgi:hypothetical protein